MGAGVRARVHVSASRSVSDQCVAVRLFVSIVLLLAFKLISGARGILTVELYHMCMHMHMLHAHVHVHVEKYELTDSYKEPF